VQSPLLPPPRPPQPTVRFLTVTATNLVANVTGVAMAEAVTQVLLVV
jgi:hypothetical protein